METKFHRSWGRDAFMEGTAGVETKHPEHRRLALKWAWAPLRSAKAAMAVGRGGKDMGSCTPCDGAGTPKSGS